MASPLFIEIGMHYWCRVDDYRGGDFSAPAVCEAIEKFVSYGMLKDAPCGSGRRYEGTNGLAVWVKALCAVNWPVQKWVIDNKDA